MAVDLQHSRALQVTGVFQDWAVFQDKKMASRLEPRAVAVMH